MKKLRLYILISLFLVLIGCQGCVDELAIDISGRANPWTHLHLNNDPDNFQFAIVADRTGEARPGVFEDAVWKVNEL